MTQICALSWYAGLIVTLGKYLGTKKLISMTAS